MDPGSPFAPSRRITHHTTVGWRDEAAVHWDEAAAVQGLWGRRGLRCLGPWGPGGVGSSAGPCDTASLAFLKPKVEALPSTQVQLLAEP